MYSIFYETYQPSSSLALHRIAKTVVFGLCLTVYLMTLRHLRRIRDVQCHDDCEWWFIRTVKGSRTYLFLGRNEKNHKTPRSGQPVCGPRFEATYEAEVLIVTPRCSALSCFRG